MVRDTFATENTFKMMDAKSPQLLHIATHGFSFKQPSITGKNANSLLLYESFTNQQNPMYRSGLVLAGSNSGWMCSADPTGVEDGLLTADEICRLDLSNTQLLVLSACETALGDIMDDEGVIGLQRAFKMAGVKQIIMSLWPVPDKETTELMLLFYQKLLKGFSPVEALRTSQLILKGKYTPYYWAAFVLVE